MNAGTPKQFLELNGKPMLMHSMERFIDAFPLIKITVALHPGHSDTWTSLCRTHRFTHSHKVVPGGETRFHSVKNALGSVENDGLVAVHDAARPLITPGLITALFNQAAKTGNAVPVVPVTESLRFVDPVDHSESRPVDRRSYFLVQTPQIFQVSLLKSAYLQPYRDLFTDDASVVEALGVKIHLAGGDPGNIKITTPDDLEFAGYRLKSLADRA